MAEEENVFVGTNCQSFDPSKVQCDKEGNMPIHILDKYCEETDTRYNIYPLTVIQAIFDGVTGTRLDRILAACNSIYLTWEGTFATFVSAYLIYVTPKFIKSKYAIWVASLWPVLINALIIGLMLNVFFKYPLILSMLQVGIGEFGVVTIIGVPLFKIISSKYPSIFNIKEA